MFFVAKLNHGQKQCGGRAANDGMGKHYFVLLIITDGVISDLEQTKAAIVYVGWPVFINRYPQLFLLG